MKTDSERRPPSAGGLGFSLVALVVVFTVAGYFLDRWLRTEPWLMVAGVFLGAGLGFVYVVLISSGGSSVSRPRKRGGSDGKGPDEDAS